MLIPFTHLHASHVGLKELRLVVCKIISQKNTGKDSTEELTAATEVLQNSEADETKESLEEANTVKSEYEAKLLGANKKLSVAMAENEELKE